tara:strand:+ start:1062 stop:1928 length:867 start_codon:yes stop_codon:yes gene_type:complete
MLVIKKTETFAQDPITEVEQDNNITVDDIKTFQTLMFDDPKNEIDLGTENIENMDDDDIFKKVATNKEQFADKGHFGVVCWWEPGCRRMAEKCWDVPFIGRQCARWCAEPYTKEACAHHDHHNFDFNAIFLDPFKNALGNITSGFTFPSEITGFVEGLGEFMKAMQNELDSFIGGIVEGFGKVGEFIKDIPDLMFGVLKMLIAAFQDLFRVLMLLMLDILRAVFSDEFLNVLEPLFRWFVEPFTILIFGKGDEDGIYHTGLQWMWYIVAAILLGIGLEVISISKILAG